MKNIVLYFLVSFSLVCCREVDDVVPQSEVLVLKSSKNTILADGSSVITFTADINDDASAEFREVIFQTESGFFVDNGESSIVVSAEKLNRDLKAEVQLRAPASMGDFNVAAEVDIQDLKGVYKDSVTIVVDTSVVTRIELAVDSFHVQNNFDGELRITAKLFNEFGGGVTAGTKVAFVDLFEDMATVVGGFYREENLSSNQSSEVSTIYSPGVVDDNQFIYIRGCVLEQNGDLTAICDKVKVFVK